MGHDQSPPHPHPTAWNAFHTMSPWKIMPLRSFDLSAYAAPFGGATPPDQSSGFSTGLMSIALPYACIDHVQQTPLRYRQLNADVLSSLIERLSSAPYRSTNRILR